VFYELISTSFAHNQFHLFIRRTF